MDMHKRWQEYDKVSRYTFFRKGDGGFCKSGALPQMHPQFWDPNIPTSCCTTPVVKNGAFEHSTTGGGLYTWSGFIVRFLYGFVESPCSNLYHLYQSRSLTSTKHHLNILDKDQLNQLDDFESLSSYQLHSTSSSHRSLSFRFLATLSLPFPLSRPGGFWEVRLFGPSCLAFKAFHEPLSGGC